MRKATLPAVLIVLLLAPWGDGTFGRDKKLQLGLRSLEEIQAEEEERAKRAANPYGDDAIPAPEDVAEVPDDAERRESGLATKLLVCGSGDSPPGPYDMVEVRYTGWTSDGVMFDTTEIEDKPRSFNVHGVVEGFSEGLQLMVAGEKRRLWIPSELGYGDEPGRPQGTLVFDLELISVKRAPETPVDVAAPPEDAVKTDSGMAYKILKAGEGEESPGPEDHVVVHFSVWRPDGALYDSSVLREKPIDFSMDLTVPAFEEAFQMMVVGEKRRLWVPEEMARLDGASKISTDMVFDVELISFVRKPVIPPDLSNPPRDAVRTESGLATKLLKPGTGNRHPAHGDRVVVHYAGWTRKGEMFDASFNYGKPGVFTLGDRMPMGWNEALKMMVVGEKRRIWIPEELAYGGREDRPQGMLVFEVELLEIQDGG
jgi:peptidylprolyl isomerase